jgi:flagellar basal-body rod protein FlgG
MTSALWVSKTGLAAQDTALRVISNNLANVTTTGFKRDRAVFSDLLYQIDQQPGGLSSQNTQLPSGTQLGVGVKIAGTQKNFAEGSIQNTSAPLDMAIDGRGFFQIALPDGSIGYTRTGSFQLDQDGQIVDSQGFPLEPAITIPEDAVSVTIGLDGTVSVVQQGDTGASEVGSIQLANFTNPAGLEAKGGNMYVETASSGAPVQGTPGENGLGTTLQNSLENSNVSVVEEMVNMVATQRAYEMNAKVVSTADQMAQYLTQNV